MGVRGQFAKEPWERIPYDSPSPYFMKATNPQKYFISGEQRDLLVVDIFICLTNKTLVIFFYVNILKSIKKKNSIPITI